MYFMTLNEMQELVWAQKNIERFFLQRKRTAPRKNRSVKQMTPRILPVLGGILGGFF